MEPYQRKVRKGYSKKKKRLLGTGGNKYRTPGFKRPSYSRSKSAPPIGESQSNDGLYEKFWDNFEIDSEIRRKLLDIANDFADSFPFELVMEDITLTGSLANYNWSKFSDIDLHIILDFKKIDINKKIVKDFFNTKKNEWNLKHNIVLNEHEVELYVQDVLEPHYSTGVFSLLSNKWLVKPKKESYQYDDNEIKNKVFHFVQKINNLEMIFNRGDYDRAEEIAEKLMKKIKNYRSSGLQKDGEHSTENVVFKTLRRGGFLARIKEMERESYDKRMGNEDPAKRDELHEKIKKVLKVIIR